MGYGYWSYAPYVTVAEKKAKAAKKLAALKKKQNVNPVIIQGHTLARTWWGKAWNQNLERYADYDYRLDRGRSYVRQGAVLDLRIEAGAIKSLVQGSRTAPYAITVSIKKLDKNTWQRVSTECAGMLESLPELLSGKFPKPLGDIFMRKDSGLFPAPKEITFTCSCPDWADMCKHVAATLYGIGARLDSNPAIFFALRGVDTGDLVSRSVATHAENMLEKAARKSARVITSDNLSSVFGIDFAEGGGTTLTDNPPKKKKPAAGGVAASNQVIKNQKLTRSIESKSPSVKKTGIKQKTKTVKTAKKKIS